MGKITHLSRQEKIKRLIINYDRRLQKLKEHQALHGLDTAPNILIEIEDIEEQIERLRAELESEEEQLLEAINEPIIPNNLPARDVFVGRDDEKARAHEALLSRSCLVSIDGIGGIGKTALALEVAHECLLASERKQPTNDITTFDGFVWATAKDRNLTLNDLFDAISFTLEHPGIAKKPMEEKQMTLDKLLRTKPSLLIVDNFETAEAKVHDDALIKFLLTLPESSKALVTTRERNLTESQMISLEGLKESDALELIDEEVKRLRLMITREELDYRVLAPLYQATTGAPLAIKWAMGQVKQGGLSVKEVVADLQRARHGSESRKVSFTLGFEGF